MIRIAHLADLHLGFRRYTRCGPRGVNQRELDVAQAFRTAMEGVRREAPDLVMIAGDLFHTVRPSNAAIALAFRELRQTVEALPAVHVVLVAGNHDLPKDVTDAVVRQVVTNVTRSVRRNLGYTAIRQYQQAALHYHFDPRTRVDAHIAPIDFALAQQTLRETVRQRLVARGGESLAALGMQLWERLDREEATQFADAVIPEVRAADRGIGTLSEH